MTISRMWRSWKNASQTFKLLFMIFVFTVVAPLAIIAKGLIFAHGTEVSKDSMEVHARFNINAFHYAEYNKYVVFHREDIAIRPSIPPYYPIYVLVRYDDKTQVVAKCNPSFISQLLTTENQNCTHTISKEELDMLERARDRGRTLTGIDKTAFHASRERNNV